MPDIWYQVRKNIGDIRHTLPEGIVGPGFNDEFGDTFGIIYGFTADGFTHRELRDYVEDVRSRLLQVPDVSKIEILGAQDEQIYVEFSTAAARRAGHRPRRPDRGAAGAERVVPAGVVQTSNEKLSLRVSGAFRSEQDILDVNFLSNGRMIRLRDIAEVRRGYADPPQPMFRVNGKPAIGLAIAMRNGGDILALGRNVQQDDRDAAADLPLGIEPTLVADQPAVVEHAIGEFMNLAVAGHRHHHGGQHHQPRPAAGRRRRAVDPADARHRLPDHGDRSDIDLQRISLGALIIALSLLVDDAMTTVDVMTTRLAQGDEQGGRRDLRLQDAGLPDADRHLRHRGGLRADRLRAERRRRIHLLDLRRRRPSR